MRLDRHFLWSCFRLIFTFFKTLTFFSKFSNSLGGFLSRGRRRNFFRFIFASSGRSRRTGNLLNILNDTIFFWNIHRFISIVLPIVSSFPNPFSSIRIFIITDPPISILKERVITMFFQALLSILFLLLLHLFHYSLFLLLFLSFLFFLNFSFCLERIECYSFRINWFF